MTTIPAIDPLLVFRGDHTPRDEATNLPTPLMDPDELGRGDQYVVDEPLRAAVNVAIALGQPLLLTGEPGSGKTRLANAIAYELRLPRLTFNVKTTSSGRDLLYTYDALRRFQDGDKARPTEDYIDYQALGLAIILAMDPAVIDRTLPEGWFDKYFRSATPAQGEPPLRAPQHGWLPTKGRATRSVVLIDEIDKAPRDLPNDLLNEFEEMEFSVSEFTVDELKKKAVRRFKAPVENRPILILTSNSERDLPDPFLRRCVYYHIAFPTDRNQLKKRFREILDARLGAAEKRTGVDAKRVAAIREAAADTLTKIRELSLDKPPSTAELLAWVRVLDQKDLLVGEAKGDVLAFTASVLAKTNADLALIRDHLRETRA